MKQHPIWFKQYWEVEHVALKGASVAVRAIYHYLRSHSPGYECEPVVNVDYRQMARELHIGQTTVSNSIKDLQKRKLIEKIGGARKDGLKFQFTFEYSGSTIRAIKGQIVVIAPSQEQGVDPFAPNQEQKRSNQEHKRSSQEQLPYIDREKKHGDDALLKQVQKQLDDLNVYERIYAPILKDALGVRFVREILNLYPDESGPVIRKKIIDPKNLNIYKTIDMFRQEASERPNGTLLRHFNTGEQGKWEWMGQKGYVRLTNDNVSIDSLASFRAWEVV